ncbi:MAG: 1-acyl-sn-glycerol-3-phosphate acyltransferase [Chitinophagales bacterium]|nr:1-acyl-sn-glycerol-3-phosphate acyltransferase [Chitinophagales bacterium]
MFEFRKFFTTKHDYLPFQYRKDGKGSKLVVWSRWYWFIQSFFVGIPYPLYYSKFKIHGWENVPKDKPIIFAESHRNAFMDSLACVATHSTQIWQLARGDAFKNPIIGKLFIFWHILPIWRERDEPGSDTQEKNQNTFEACYDLLAHRASIGIYPEGDCINENHIRPIKKGICRIAFGAEEKYNYDLDIQIVPVGVSYTAADKFKHWAIIHFGKPVAVKDYIETYKATPAPAINNLKNDIEKAMQSTVVHIKKTPLFHEKDQLVTIYARHKILSEGRRYDPLSKLQEEQKTVSLVEQAEAFDHESLQHLPHDIKTYNGLMQKFNFRENTFDPAKQHPLSIFFMGFYFVIMFPLFIYGSVINYLPYIIPQKIVNKKIQQKIFHSSIRYVISLFMFTFYYVLLFFIIWEILGSVLSALIFLVSFPIAGHIAYYYWYDLKKWRSVQRFKRKKRQKNTDLQALLTLREKLTVMVRSFDEKLTG